MVLFRLFLEVNLDLTLVSSSWDHAERGWEVACLLCQSCLTLCDPMDCRPPGSSVHGILQARGLEQAAISFSRRPCPHRGPAHLSCISCTGRGILYHRATWEAHFM